MNDVRLFLRVLVMFLPLPIFWALFDQQVGVNIRAHPNHFLSIADF